MRYDEEEEGSSEAPKLPLIISFASSPKLSLLLQASSSDIGEETDMVQASSPRLRTSVSVPFLWEEEPGKPRPCTALINNINNINATSSSKCLDHPPRLQQTDFSRLVTRTPSPTSVFDGPYVQAMSVFSSLSFRFNASKRHDSFDRKNPETTLQIGALFLDPPQLHHHHHHQGGIRRKCLFGALGLKHKNTKVEGSERDFVSDDNFVFSPLLMDDALSPTTTTTPCSDGKEVKMASKMRRNGSFSTLSHSKSQFWATMYKGFKHAIPRKGKK